MNPAVTVAVTLPMKGGLIVLALMTLGLTVLAAYGLRRFRALPGAGRDPLGRLRHDLCMAIGMTTIGWFVTCVALLVNPTLGADDPGGSEATALYSISRGCLMLVFWQAVGFSAFLLSQLRVRHVAGGTFTFADEAPPPLPSRPPNMPH